MGFIYHSITLHCEVYSYNKRTSCRDSNSPSAFTTKNPRSSCVEKISPDDVPGGSCNANPSLLPPVISHFSKRRAVPHCRFILIHKSLPNTVDSDVEEVYDWKSTNFSCLIPPSTKTLKLTAGFTPENRWMLGKCSFPFGGFGLFSPLG